jgi:hypothetical protein
MRPSACHRPSKRTVACVTERQHALSLCFVGAQPGGCLGVFRPGECLVDDRADVASGHGRDDLRGQTGDDGTARRRSRVPQPLTRSSGWPAALVFHRMSAASVWEAADMAVRGAGRGGGVAVAGNPASPGPSRPGGWPVARPQAEVARPVAHRPAVRAGSGRARDGTVGRWHRARGRPWLRSRWSPASGPPRTSARPRRPRVARGSSTPRPPPAGPRRDSRLEQGTGRPPRDHAGRDAPRRRHRRPRRGWVGAGRAAR